MKTTDDLIREAIELDAQIKATTDAKEIAKLKKQLAVVKEAFWKL